MRSRRVFRLSWKAPRRDFPQMNVNPKNIKVSGLSRPCLLRLAAAWRPNSISRVLSGWSDNENSSSRVRIASRKRRASSSVLEANDQIVGVSHDDHLALGFTPPPAISPEIKAVVQVDIGKKR